MMLQRVQSRFLFFINQRAFAARSLTFEFSNPKRYNIVSSPPFLRGGPAFFLGPGLGGNYQNMKTRGLNMEKRKVEI